MGWGNAIVIVSISVFNPEAILFTEACTYIVTTAIVILVDSVDLNEKLGQERTLQGKE